MILDREHQVTGPGYTVISASEIRAKLPYGIIGRTIQSVVKERSGAHPLLVTLATLVPQFSCFSQL